MQARALAMEGAWEFTPKSYADDRGLFLEWFKADVLAATIGRRFTIAQANQSVSRRGVLRGLHFAAVPPGQAKYVYCPVGAVLDVVVDVRVGSPTFGAFDAVRLDDVDRRAVFLAEGLGHAFVCLADGSAVTYLCSTGYNPSGEFGVDPVDPAMALPWPADLELILSDKDRDAPTLAEAAERGILPTYQDCRSFYRTLRA